MGLNLKSMMIKMLIIVKLKGRIGHIISQHIKLIHRLVRLSIKSNMDYWGQDQLINITTPSTVTKEKLMINSEALLKLHFIYQTIQDSSLKLKCSAKLNHMLGQQMKEGIIINKTQHKICIYIYIYLIFQSSSFIRRRRQEIVSF